MIRIGLRGKRLVVSVAAMCCLTSPGCLGHHELVMIPPPPGSVPTELNMVTFPPYVIAPPDVLQIIVYSDSKDPTKNATELPVQQIIGPHLVRPDGTVHLGVWGDVLVSGLSLAQAKSAIAQQVYSVTKTDKRIGEKFPIKSADDLFVTVDVMAYNSKNYYIIADGAGFGEQIYPLPSTGSETVLDALSKINGLPDIASKSDIWVARRSPQPGMPQQMLPVDYVAITKQGVSLTNYQIFPGDRLYVKAQTIFAVDRFLQKALTPVERILGVTLLGSSTVNSIKSGGTTTGQ